MGDAPLFVVQEHNASRLHYDFRLEVGGRLVSWAVPRGPSMDPGERRLAVRVEDHPVEWGEFEGVIEDGDYGAGEVIVWDRGTWRLLGDQTAEEALDHGKLLILLGGRKLRGRFVLIRTDGGKIAWEGGRENWLLIKLKDRYATPGEDVTAQRQASVVSGRTIADLKQGTTHREPAAALRVKPRQKAEVAEQTSAEDAAALAEEIRAAGDQSMELHVGDATVKLTNLDKVFWEDLRSSKPEAEGRPAILKRDFIAYYADVAPWLLAYLADRPLTLRRYVDGAMGKAFYQRDWHDEPPDFVRLVPIWATTPGRDFHAVVCDNLATLLWLANTADLEMHAWYSRISNDGDEWPEACAGSEEAAEACALNYPDYVVFDLDPWIKEAKEPTAADRLAALAACKQVAAMVREVLKARGLRPYIKTSGKTGLHILAPIERRHRFEETREFAREIGADLAKEHPDEVSVEWRIAKRTGHVLVDHMQNVRAKTLPAPYSLRATEVASVSMPLRWEDLEAADSFDFTLRTVPGILRKRGDAWAGILDHRAPL